MSHNINDLGALWKSRNTPPPNVAALMEAARAFRRKHIVKLVRTNLMLLATTAWVLYIVYAWNPQMLTTRIGVGLIITGMLGYLVVYNRLLPLLLRVPEQANSARYLQQLHTLQLWQKMLHYTATHLYFLLLWGGITLYLVEPTSRMVLWQRLATYAVTFAWVIFNWVYTRPRTIRKQQAAIEEHIARCARLQQQLSE